MSTQPCCVRSLCQNPANPFENLSSENPDQEVFIGYDSGGWYSPTLNGSWIGDGCVSQVESTVSQKDADLKAAQQQIFCTTQPCNSPNCNGGNTGGGGGQPNPPPPPQLFSNSFQECTAICPDGLPFTFGFQAGQVTALSQAQADLIAQSLACILADDERLCLNNIPSSACFNQFYVAGIAPSGGQPPFAFSVISGSIPPGMSFIQDNPNSVTISGTPTTPGLYTFTVQVVDRGGLFFRKNYTIGVVNITNSPGSASIGTPYSFTYIATGGTPPYTFALEGTLPDGLTMDATGHITGTPLNDAVSETFGVTVTDSTP